jgi:hypothetical protein
MEKSSKEKITGWLSSPWYPFVFSLYPILTLLYENVGQVDLTMGLRPAILSLLFAGLLYGLLFLFLRDRFRAAILTTLWLVLFFSYGHVHIYIDAKVPGNGITQWLLILWLALAILFLWMATRPELNFSPSVKYLNLISAALVFSLTVQIVMAEREADTHHSLGAAEAPVQNDLILPQPAPDVYYIILDSYGRQDLLMDAYGYDNGPFIEALRQRGFYVPECAQSNYVRTELSLGSSLNMSYLQELDPAFVPESIKRSPLWRALKHSAVRYNFENLGYRTITFANGFEWSEWDDADLFLSPPLTASMNEFESLFLQTTLGYHARQWGLLNTDPYIGQTYRNRTLLAFDKLADIASMPEPTFTYIHLIPPHPPFVFGPDGEPTDFVDFLNENRKFSSGLYADGYQNQLTFVNRKMLEAIDTLLAESDTPPIIVIQGDHGPWYQPDDDRAKIFNAYYLPGHSDRLYSTITPVNTFRLIFDAYFGGNYDLVPDASYFSPVPNLYEFSEISNPCVK